MMLGPGATVCAQPASTNPLSKTDSKHVALLMFLLFLFIFSSDCLSLHCKVLGPTVIRLRAPTSHWPSVADTRAVSFCRWSTELGSATLSTGDRSQTQRYGESTKGNRPGRA